MKDQEEKKNAKQEPEKKKETKHEKKNQEVEKLKSEVADLQNKLLYKEAEFVNFRRRLEEANDEKMKYIHQPLLLDIITSYENLERAIASIKCDDEKDHEKMLAGIDMILKEMKATLTKYGVEEINTADIPVDFSIHEAIMVENHPDKEDGIVLEIMRKGYKLKDRVIRPAMVKVNQK